MRIVILGSGVVGTASTWYLNRAGHEVTVIDREPGAALETSATNTGQISPGYAAPQVAPDVPLGATKWMFQHHAPLAVRLDGTQFQLRWVWQTLHNCDTSHYVESEGWMVRPAEYSRNRLKASRAEASIQYEERQGGALQLFRTEQQYKNATRDTAVLKDTDVPYQLLESSRLAEVKPVLAEVAYKLTDGLQLPNDETGDCQLFTQNLAWMAERARVKFRSNTLIDQLLYDGEQIYGIKCDGEVIKADAYVMAFGSYSTTMLRGTTDIPVHPLKDYSLTIPITQEDGAPVSTILGKTYKIVTTRFDNHIRVGRTAGIVGFNTKLLQPCRKTLEMIVRDLYPRGGHAEQVTFWTGLRPITLDGTPVVERTCFKNLWLNAGHGTLGWTMACGFGQLLNDPLSGRTPAILYENLSAAHYSRGFTPLRPSHLHDTHS